MKVQSHKCTVRDNCRVRTTRQQYFPPSHGMAGFYSWVCANHWDACIEDGGQPVETPMQPSPNIVVRVQS